MKRNKLIGLGTFGFISVLLLSGCTAMDDMGKDFTSDNVGIPRIVTVYSKTGEVLKRYEGNNVRTTVDASGQVKINLDGKRIQVLYADVVIEEK
jgi:hypothetical protein